MYKIGKDKKFHPKVLKQNVASREGERESSLILSPFIGFQKPISLH